MIPFLLKINWEILTLQYELWAKVIWGKYHNRGIGLDQTPKTCAYDSSLWKNIVASWPILKSNVHYSLGDGNSINFWNHDWIGKNIILHDFSLNPFLFANSQDNVASFVSNSGNYDFHRMETLLPANIVNKIRAFLPLPSDGKDSIIWSRTTNGSFSIKSV